MTEEEAANGQSQTGSASGDGGQDVREQLEGLRQGVINFECHPGVTCFTDCCAKLNLMLTPYDIIRLSRRLEMRTDEFLDKHTFAVEEPAKLPKVRLEMNESDNRCPFVTDKGCSVYEDRPSACRAYPIARAAAPGAACTQEAFFVIREDHCKGFGLGTEWTAEKWMKNQGLEEYNEKNDLWMEVLAKQGVVFQSPGQDARVKMYNLASYNLDEFRRFVMESGLADRLALRPSVLKRLEQDDDALLVFAMKWLRFALYGETRINFSELS